MPRSTMLTGISGSSTSRSASSSRSSSDMGVGLPELVELLLEGRDHLGVAGPAGAPALDDVVPGARIADDPALRLGVERAGEGIVERVGVALPVGGDPDADLLAV